MYIVMLFYVDSFPFWKRAYSCWRPSHLQPLARWKHCIHKSVLDHWMVLVRIIFSLYVFLLKCTILTLKYQHWKDGINNFIAVIAWIPRDHFLEEVYFLIYCKIESYFHLVMQERINITCGFTTYKFFFLDHSMK